MLNLYFGPGVWDDVAADVTKVIDFFRSHETVRTRDGRTFFGKVQPSAEFAPQYILNRRGPMYEAALVRPGDLVGTNFNGDRIRQLTHIPYINILLTREDLLAVAVSAVATPSGALARSKAQVLLERLWGLHVSGLHGRKFDDNIADEITRSISYLTDPRIPQGALWTSATIVEIVVPSWQRDAAHKLCLELEQELRKVSVVQTPHKLYAGSWTGSGPSAQFVPVKTLVPDADNNLVVRAVPSGQTLAVKREGKPHLGIRRGLSLNTTQAAVAVALAPEDVLVSLERLMDAVRSGPATAGSGSCAGGSGSSVASSASVASNTSFVSRHLLPVLKTPAESGAKLSFNVNLTKLVTQDLAELTWLIHARHTHKSCLGPEEDVGASSMLSVLVA
jgi:hypothetical protein